MYTCPPPDQATHAWQHALYVNPREPVAETLINYKPSIRTTNVCRLRGEKAPPAKVAAIAAPSGQPDRYDAGFRLIGVRRFRIAASCAGSVSAERRICPLRHGLRMPTRVHIPFGWWLLLLGWAAGRAEGCFRSASTTSAPSTQTCPPGPANTAGLTANGVTLQNAGDTSTPVAHSATCSAGTRNYWTATTASTPDDATANGQKAIGVQCPNTASICVCTCAGVCCQPGSDAPDTVSFIPFCSGGTCEMFTFLEGDSGSSLQCSDGNTFTVAQETNSDGSFTALNSGNYLQAASVSCNGCSSIQTDTCSNTIDSGATSIS